MLQQRKSNSMKTNRPVILHIWNNAQRSLARITKTAKYNITKIKQQSTIEDRSRRGRQYST